jgi:hypothetical protein
MEEEAIELWYEEEKQKLSEAYMHAIEKGMALDSRQKKFDKAMHKLDSEYNARHWGLLQKKVRTEKRKKAFNFLIRPFLALGAALAHLFIGLFALLKHGFRAKYGQLHFSAGMFWIRNAYKVPDGTRVFFRPFYHFYIRYLQIPLYVMSRPFVAFGKAVKRFCVAIGAGFSAAAAFSWKYIKIGAKMLFAALGSFGKKVSAKHEAWSKRYHEWYSKRLQASLERKQAKKEEKEKKRKEKAARKGEAAGEKTEDKNPEGPEKL